MVDFVHIEEGEDTISIRLMLVDTPDAPPVGYADVYVGLDGLLHFVDDNDDVYTPLVAEDIGVTVQAFSAELDAAAAIATTGFVKRTGNDTWVAADLDEGDIPSLTDYVTVASIGSAVQAYSAQLASIAGVGNGIVARTAANTVTPRTLTGAANRVVITDGDGVAANPTFDIGTDVVTLLGAQGLENKTFNTIIVIGTAGAGYAELPSQASAPSTPTSGFRVYADSTHRLSWKGQNGFVRTFDGTANSADRNYTLPNASGTLVLQSTAVAFTTIAGSGDLTLSGAPGRIKPAVDSTTAIQVTNAAASTAVLVVDTTNTRVGIGKTPVVALDVNGTILCTTLNTANISPAANNTITLGVNQKIVSGDNQYYGIDSNNDSTANFFSWQKDSTTAGSGTELMRLDEAGLLNIFGSLQVDALRLDVSPTSETIVPTHTITISVSGTNYKIPIVAA